MTNEITKIAWGLSPYSGGKKNNFKLSKGHKRKLLHSHYHLALSHESLRNVRMTMRQVAAHNTN